MKKKLLSLMCMVALIITMLPTTVFAANASTSLNKVETDAQKALDYYISYNMQAFSDPRYQAMIPDDYIVSDFAYDVFLIERSGLQSESAVAYKDFVFNHLDANLAKNNCILDMSDEETVETYACVILALLSIDKNPTNYKGYNIVEMFSDHLATVNKIISWAECDVSSIPALTMVLDHYKGYSTAIDDARAAIDEEIINTYVKNGINADYFVTNYRLDVFGVENVLTQFESGVDYDYDGYGNVIVRLLKNEIKDDFLTAFNTGSADYYKGKFYLNSDNWLGVRFVNQSNVGFTEAASPGLDTDAYSLIGLSFSSNPSAIYDTETRDVPNDTISVNEAVSRTIDKFAKSIGDDGFVTDPSTKYDDDFEYNVNDNSYCLLGLSVAGEYDASNKAYEGLMKFQLADGSFEYELGVNVADPVDSLRASESLLAYYYMLAYDGSMYDLSLPNISKDEPPVPDQNNVVEMNTPETTQWKPGSGKWLTFSSPLPLSELLDIQIDGKSVFGDYISTDADGVMLFNAIGGGFIKVWEGSTYVSFSPEFMATLGSGEHTVRIQSTSGYAETSFSVTAPATTPSTGDVSNMGLFLTLTACGLGMAVVAVARKAKAER